MAKKFGKIVFPGEITSIDDYYHVLFDDGDGIYIYI